MSAHTLDRLIRLVHNIDDLSMCPKPECNTWMRRSDWSTANSPPSSVAIEYLCTVCNRAYQGDYNIKTGYHIKK